MTVAISTVLPELRMELANVPDPVLHSALFRVIRQFFWDSEAWKYTYDNGLDWTLNQLAVEAPVAGTDIPAKCIVKRVDTIQYDSGGDSWDEVIPFKTRDELDRYDPDWQTATGSSPLAWTHGNNGGAVITPQVTATVTTALLIKSVIVPVFTAITDTLPDFLYYENEEYFKAGVLSQLMKMPNKDWSDMNSAQVYGAIYSAGVDKTKSRAESDYGQPTDTMAYGGL
jgi:hypothetical protein